MMQRKINLIHGPMKKYYKLNFDTRFEEAVRCPQGESTHTSMDLALNKRQKSKVDFYSFKLLTLDYKLVLHCWTRGNARAKKE